MFDESEVATGSACVELHRAAAVVHAAVVDCPVTLPEAQPWSDSYSWGKDSVAVAFAARAIGSAVDNVRRSLSSESDDRPNSDRTAADIVRAAEADRSIDDSHVVAGDLAQTGRILTLTLTATATTPEAVDISRTATARWCARLRVDLDDRNPNAIGDEGPCA